MASVRVKGLAVPDIGEMTFLGYLDAQHSPVTAAEASAVYAYCMQRQVSPASVGQEPPGGWITLPLVTRFVLLLGQQFKVAQFIVVAYLVNMMHFVVIRDVVPQVSFHDENVLQDIALPIRTGVSGAVFQHIACTVLFYATLPFRALGASLRTLPGIHTTFSAPARAIMLGAICIHKKRNAAHLAHNGNLWSRLARFGFASALNVRPYLRLSFNPKRGISPFRFHGCAARHNSSPLVSLSMFNQERIPQC